MSSASATGLLTRGLLVFGRWIGPGATKCLKRRVADLSLFTYLAAESGGQAEVVEARRISVFTRLTRFAFLSLIAVGALCCGEVVARGGLVSFSLCLFALAFLTFKDAGLEGPTVGRSSRLLRFCSRHGTG